MVFMVYLLYSSLTSDALILGFEGGWEWERTTEPPCNTHYYTCGAGSDLLDTATASCRIGSLGRWTLYTVGIKMANTSNTQHVFTNGLQSVCDHLVQYTHLLCGLCPLQHSMQTSMWDSLGIVTCPGSSPTLLNPLRFTGGLLVMVSFWREKSTQYNTCSPRYTLVIGSPQIPGASLRPLSHLLDSPSLQYTQDSHLATSTFCQLQDYNWSITFTHNAS